MGEKEAGVFEEKELTGGFVMANLDIDSAYLTVLKTSLKTGIKTGLKEDLNLSIYEAARRVINNIYGLLNVRRADGQLHFQDLEETR